MKKLLFFVVVIMLGGVFVPNLGFAATANRHPIITSLYGPVQIPSGKMGTWTLRTRDPDGDALWLIVDWNDNSSSTIYVPAGTSSIITTHKLQKAYAVPSLHQMTIRANDSQGTRSETRMDVNVMNASTTYSSSTITYAYANRHPIITSLSGPTNLITNKSYTYAVRSYEPNTDPYSVFVDWGDGMFSSSTIVQSTTTALTKFSHSYRSGGRYLVRTGAHDYKGALGETYMNLDVQTSTSTATSTMTSVSASASLLTILQEQVEQLTGQVERLIDQIKE